jgi:hypothetical protein
MPRDLVGELLRKGLKCLTGVLVEVLRADVVRDRRTVIDLLCCGPVAFFLATIAACFVRLAVPTRGLRLAIATLGPAVAALARRLAIATRRIAGASSISALTSGFATTRSPATGGLPTVSAGVSRLCHESILSSKCLRNAARPLP